MERASQAWKAATLILCACAVNCLGGPSQFVGGTYRDFTPALDAALRKQLLDQYLRKPLAPAGANFEFGPEELTQILGQADSDIASLGTSNRPEFLVNPEPSSALVWTTSVIGLLAAGYGYRRRQTDAG